MTARRARRRPRAWQFVPAALAAHAGLLLLLNLLTPRAEPPYAVGAIDVSLLSGPNAGGGEFAAPAPAASAAPAAEIEPVEAPDPQPPAEPPLEPIEAADPAAVEPPPPPDRVAEAQPERPAEDADVLDAVRALVGAESWEAATAASATAPAAATTPGLPGGGSKCEAGGAVLEALLDDPDALEALGRLPRSALSVAGALQLWDGRTWTDDPALGGSAGLKPVRAAIDRGILNAPAECLTAPFLGPRFLVLPTKDGPVTLVIGSGEWRWADALTPQTSVPK